MVDYIMDKGTITQGPRDGKANKTDICNKKVYTYQCIFSNTELRTCHKKNPQMFENLT